MFQTAEAELCLDLCHDLMTGSVGVWKRIVHRYPESAWQVVSCHLPTKKKGEVNGNAD